MAPSIDVPTRKNPGFVDLTYSSIRRVLTTYVVIPGVRPKWDSKWARVSGDRSTAAVASKHPTAPAATARKVQERELSDRQKFFRWWVTSSRSGEDSAIATEGRCLGKERNTAHVQHRRNLGSTRVR